MDILKKLTLKNIKMNKKRSIMTIIGIMLSTALICTVAGMIMSVRKSLIEYTKYENGDYHFAVYDIPEDKTDLVKNDSDVDEVFDIKNLGYSRNGTTDNKYIYYNCVQAMSRESMERLSMHLKSGRYPENGSEIVVSQSQMLRNAIKYEIGDSVELELGKRINDINGRMALQGENLWATTDEETGEIEEVLEHLETVQTKTFTVVGVVDYIPNVVSPYTTPSFSMITLDTADNGPVLAVSEAVLVSNPAKFDEPFGRIVSSLSSALDVSEIPSNKNENLLKFQGALSDRAMSMLYGLGSIIGFIIIFSSVFVIRNSFAISVQEKNRQFGMLSSIGATTKQIRRSVIYEGFLLGVVGIPAGILLGVSVVLILVKILNVLIPDLMGETGFCFSMHPLIFVVAILSGAITIYFSCLFPALVAGKISPIVAIRSNEDIKVKKNGLKVSNLTRKVFGIGGVISAKNLKRSKQKYKSTVISLIMSVSVFIGLYSFVGYSKEAIGFSMPDVDYNVQVLPHGENKEVRAAYQYVIDHFEMNGYTMTYHCYYGVDGLSDYFNSYAESQVAQGRNVEPAVYLLNDEYFKEYAKKAGIKDVKDNTAILLDRCIEINNGVREEVRYYEDIKEKSFTTFYHGISENGEDDKKTIEITRVTDVIPRGFEGEGFIGGMLFLSEKLFSASELDEEWQLNYLFVDAKNPDTFEGKFNELASSQAVPELKYAYVYNYSQQVRESKNLVFVLEIFLYGFIIVISLIGVTNILNTISTNMALRSKEFAMLRSVGMTKKEFDKMIRLESVMYGLKSLIVGIPLGMLISFLVYKVYGNQYYLGFIFPWQAIIISILGVFIIVSFTMKYSMGKIKKQNIIEAIRRENI